MEYNSFLGVEWNVVVDILGCVIVHQSKAQWLV